MKGRTKGILLLLVLAICWAGFLYWLLIARTQSPCVSDTNPQGVRCTK